MEVWSYNIISGVEGGILLVVDKIMVELQWTNQVAKLNLVPPPTLAIFWQLRHS